MHRLGFCLIRLPTLGNRNQRLWIMLPTTRNRLNHAERIPAWCMMPRIESRVQLVERPLMVVACCPKLHGVQSCLTIGTRNALSCEGSTRSILRSTLSRMATGVEMSMIDALRGRALSLRGPLVLLCMRTT
jgi:hypothetical protein